MKKCIIKETKNKQKSRKLFVKNEQSFFHSSCHFQGEPQLIVTYRSGWQTICQDRHDLATGVIRLLPCWWLRYGSSARFGHYRHTAVSVDGWSPADDVSYPINQRDL